jgi:uncharacterized protein YjbI with pentapeptide repeats
VQEHQSEQPVQTTPEQPRPYPWLILFSPLVIAIVTSLVFAAWAAHRSPSIRWWLEHFSWSAVATLIGAGGAITAALITLSWQDRQRQALEQQFREKQSSDRKAFDEKQRADEVHFAIQGLESHFVDVQNRFASSDPIQRAYAAVRLSEMAVTQCPSWTEGSTKTKYPFYPRAASLLSAALHMESDQSVRDEVEKAVVRMAEFDKSPPQSLLHGLISEMADANRSAKSVFIELLSEYFAPSYSRHMGLEEDKDRGIQGLLPLVSFSNDTRVLNASLRSLTDTDTIGLKAFNYADRRKIQSLEERRAADKTVKDRLRLGAELLLDCRDALATSIRALKKPSNAPSLVEDSRGWVRECPVILDGCFLAGSSLEEAQLQGADLVGTHLQGCNLASANLQRANMCGAKIQFADLWYAVLWRSRVENVQANSAELIQCDLRYAHLQNVDLSGAKLWGAMVAEGHIQGLGGTKLIDTNWWDADYAHPITNEVDENLLASLESSFQKPASSDNEEPAPRP